MRELKTLKDLKDFDKVHPDGKTYWVDVKDYVNRGKLREEAKNWIQELSKVQVDREGLANTAIIMDNNAKIGWINQFFNLEEEK